MKKNLPLLVTATLFSVQVFAQNVGIGTSTPNTKLEVNGAIASTPVSAAAAAAVVIPDNTSIFRLTLTASTQANALSMATPHEGQLLTIYNADDDAATFSGQTIAATNGVLSVNYINGGWRTVSNTKAGGDLSGTYPNPTVAKIQGKDVSTAAPANGDILKYNTTTSKYEPSPDLNSGGTVATVTASSPLNSTGGANPNISLTGTVPVANGGTGLTAIGAGQILIGTTAGGFLNTNLTGTTNQVNVANASGSVTLSTPQNIATNSDVTFNTVTAGGANVNSVTATGSIKPGTTTAAANTAGAGAVRTNGTNLEYSDGTTWKILSSGGTVTTVTGTAPISVATGTTTPVISITAATGSAAGSMSAADKAKLDAITGTNTGDQTITLTSDVTGSGTGSFPTTIAAGVVTNAKLANVATATFKGRTSAGTGSPEDLTAAQAKTLLNLTGTNSGDQTITLTGDVTGSGTGSFATTVGQIQGRVVNPVAPTGGQALVWNSGTSKWEPTTITSGTITGSGSTGYVPYWTSASNISFDNTSGGQYFWDATNHRLGIGNISPTAKLDVTGPATGSGITIHAGGGGDVVLGSGGSLFFDDNFSYANGNYIRPVAANTQAFFTAGAERARITSTGNVGIATTGPLNKLDVNGAAAVGSYAGANTAPSNGLIISGNTGLGTPAPLSKLDVNGGVAVGGYAANNAAPASGLIVSGNMGVGTPAPSTKLQVVGGSQTISSVLTDGHAEDVSGLMDGNFIPSHTWTVSSGSVGIFGENGAGVSTREWGDGPSGNRCLLWKCFGTGNSADGGWNTNTFTIDNTKTYRVSVWVKRTSNASGTTYVGCGGANVTYLTGGAETNPYFFCSGSLPQVNQWYLIVGYIHGSGDASTTNSGGVYDGVTGQKVISLNGNSNCSADFKFTTSATTQQQRAYLYYNGNSGVQQWFWDPKFEEVNGKETPLSSLVGVNSPASGSTSYVQNTTVQQASSNFNISGIGVTPTLQLTNANTALTQGAGNSLQVTTNTGYLQLGPQNASWSHFQTDRPAFYFNKRITVDEGIISSYAQDLNLQTSATTRMTILNTNGNVGVGTTSPAFKLHVPSGYIGTDYFNSTDNSVGSGVTGIMVKQGDNYHRTATAAAVLAFLGVTAPTGDNLGNHTATTTLNMNYNLINHVSDIIADNNYGQGLVGVYSSTNYQNVFAMGTAYRLATNGTTPGNLYGIAWTHSNVGGQSKAALSHQMLVMENGVTKVALGTGIWMQGDLTFNSANPYINAPSYYVCPGGAYFNSGTVYTEARIQARGGVNNDNGGSLILTSNNNIVNAASSYLQVASKYAIDATDSWLRLNQQNSFGSGTYTPYQLRTDGGLVSGGIGTSGGGYIDASRNIRTVGGSQGTLELTSDLPGYSINTYPTVKTSGSYMYFSVANAYTSYIAPGGTYNAVSSRVKKENFEVLDKQDILNKIGELEIYKWNYKVGDPNVKHIGPIAEDFWDKFHLNDNDVMVSHIDPAGVALAGLQALNENYKSQQKQIETIQSTISDFGSINVNSKEIWVNFNSSFTNLIDKDQLPTVTVTANQPNVNLFVTEKNNKGFKLVLSSELLQDLNIDYIAMAHSSPAPVAVSNPVKSSESEIVAHHNQSMAAFLDPENKTGKAEVKPANVPSPIFAAKYVIDNPNPVDVKQSALQTNKQIKMDVETPTLEKFPVIPAVKEGAPAPPSQQVNPK